MPAQPRATTTGTYPHRRSPRVSHRSRKDLKHSFSKETRAHPSFVHPDRLAAGAEEAGGVPTPPGAVNALDSLIFTYFMQTGFILRCSPDGISGYWLKCAIRSRQFPRHYLLVHTTVHQGFCGGLVILCGKIQQMMDGDLRPSPDIWEGG